MATNYQELIKVEMFDKEWVLQDTLLSGVARKKHGISKAGDKKKGAVLIALKSMYRKGILKKEVDEDGNVFWGKRSPGDEPIVLREKTIVEVDPFELTRLTTARKNIKFLEEALQGKFSEILEKTYKKDWERHINATTYEKLKDQYHTSKKKTWVPGGSPSDLLAVAGIKDFSYIIADKKDRDLYARLFPNTFIMGAKLSELGDYRNRIQHNDSLSKEEYIYFNITAQLLLKGLSQK